MKPLAGITKKRGWRFFLGEGGRWISRMNLEDFGGEASESCFLFSAGADGG